MKKILLCLFLFVSFNSFAVTTYLVTDNRADGICGDKGSYIDPVASGQCLVGKIIPSDSWKGNKKIIRISQANKRYIEAVYESTISGDRGFTYTHLLGAALECEEPKFINSDGECQDAPDQCTDDVLTGLNWDQYMYGDSPSLCVDSCEYNVSIALCFDDGQCSGDGKGTSQSCSESEPGGSFPTDECEDCIVPMPDLDDDDSELDKPDFNEDNPDSNLDTDNKAPDNENVGQQEGDQDVLDSISNLNSDLNSQLTDLNNDIADGFNEGFKWSETINDTLHAIGNNNADGFNMIDDALHGQNQVITDSANSTNSYINGLKSSNETGFSNLTKTINEGYSGLEESLSKEFGELGELNKKGFDDLVESIGELTKDKMVDVSSGGVEELYSSSDIQLLESQVAGLKKEYESILNDFHNYFQFNDGLSSGSYDPHNLTLNVSGNTISRDNFGLSVLVDNANIISYVVLFMFGLAGIRVILKAS